MDCGVEDYNDACWHQLQSEYVQQLEVSMAFPSLKVKSSSGPDRELIPEGLHYAICATMVDLGIQKARAVGNNDSRQVYIGFELPEVRIKFQKDGKEIDGPALTGRQFGMSIGKKSQLRPFLKGWRGGKDFTAEEEAGFEITSIVGKVCQLFIKHNTAQDGKTYANIESAIGLTNQMKQDISDGKRSTAPEMDGGLLVYSTEAPDKETYARLPEWLRKKIDEQIKPVIQPGGTVSDPNGFDDSIPF